MSSAPVDLCTVPLGRRPDGTWDFVDVDSQQKIGITICVLFTTLALLIALPRLYVNRRQLKIADRQSHSNPSDFPHPLPCSSSSRSTVYLLLLLLKADFTTLSLVFSIANAVLVSLHSRYYRHDWNLPACWFNADYAKFCMTFFATFVQTFPRAAIFLLYRQLFQVPSSRIQVAIWTGLGVTFLTNVPDIPIAVVVYQKFVPDDGRTSDFRLLGPVQGAFGVALDILAFVIPLPIIARLKLSRRKKRLVFLLFSTGALGIVASIVAMVYKVRMWTDTREIMWFQGPVYICAHAEACISIVVGSMPAFSNFMNQYVLKSSAVRGLRSKLRAGSRSTTEQGSSGSKRARPLRGTIGSSSEHKKRPPYYELTDVGNTMNSMCSASAGDTRNSRVVRPGQILRTTDVRQEVQTGSPSSADNLV
ncbi:hypothetical protein PG988_011302 [Apiospora saccharicola]